MHKRDLVSILLPLKISWTDAKDFTYFNDCNAKIGDIVEVEFGKKKLWSLLIKTAATIPKDLSHDKIKPIIRIHECIKISENYIKFIEKFSTYNLIDSGLLLKSSISPLNSKIIQKKIEPYKQVIDPKIFDLKSLLPEQEDIFHKISNNLDSNTILLDGVTGSGKTEVYFAIIAKILTECSDSQILILLPEIALTSQLLIRFNQQFKFLPQLWHSKVSPKDKREIFYGVNSGSVRLLIGARSALLLPFHKLKLIIVDEEHDQSFKQEELFTFHARDMAILRSKAENFPIILSSATPSIESYYNALSGKYLYFPLNNKFGSKNEVKLVDLRREKLKQNEFLSKDLRYEIEQNLLRKQQTILFLNRRGYAKVSLCKACGQKYQCLNCDTNLVLHKRINRLICHYCGHEELPQEECKVCKTQDSIINVGIGIEKVEEEIQKIFPSARIANVTSDHVNDFDDSKKMVEKILSREIDIIIGTQMIAKGHDFPGLTLVGIIDADSMLYGGKLRTLERSHQLITQVIGRAGRGRESGKVIIQTYNPENLLLERIINSQRDEFYNFEIESRRSLKLPPFSRLAKIEISAFDQSDAKEFARNLVCMLPQDDRILAFGPAPNFILRIKNRYHFIINIQAEKQVNLQKMIGQLLKKIEVPKAIRIKIDIDPM